MKTIIVIGGSTGTGSLSSAEYYNDHWGWWEEDFPSLPVEVHQHCTVLLPNFVMLVIGGIQGGVTSKKTYIFQQFTWREGPELKFPRSGASCGLVNNDQIVIAGGYNNDGHLSSTEVKC